MYHPLWSNTKRPEQTLNLYLEIHNRIPIGAPECWIIILNKILLSRERIACKERYVFYCLHFVPLLCHQLQLIALHFVPCTMANFHEETSHHE